MTPFAERHGVIDSLTWRPCKSPSDSGGGRTEANITPLGTRTLEGMSIDHDDDRKFADRRRTQRHRFQGRRPVAGGIRPQGTRSGRARDARPDVAAPRIRRSPAAQGRAHLGLAAHDGPDRRADRDAGRAGRRGPLGLLQHLLHPGPRRRRGRRRPARHARGAQGRPGVRVEGRDARGVLVGRRADADLAGRAGEHDPRRRW